MIFDHFNFDNAVRAKRLEHEKLLSLKNRPSGEYNGKYVRFENPVLTAEHIPLEWRYDFNKSSNPFFIERLGINAVFNSGALYFNGKFLLMARVEGNDRKSFFAIAESDNGVDNFRFREFPETIPALDGETNIYDVRLTAHEDGYIYGIFCSESKDTQTPDVSAAVASAGIIRTKDLKSWERLPNLKTKSPQQRNVVLHPDFVGGKYAFYTRPQDGFIEAGGGGGICIGYSSKIDGAEIDKEILLIPRVYHTVMESKNGAGAVPIKTEKGYIHIAHGVRNTAAGLRYVIFTFATDLSNPEKIIALPGGYYIAPERSERIGDVSNVVFTNGAIVNDGKVYIYYGGSDTRLYVAVTTIDRLIDYTFNTPPDALVSAACVKQRIELIINNKTLKEKTT